MRWGPGDVGGDSWARFCVGFTEAIPELPGFRGTAALVDHASAPRKFPPTSHDAARILSQPSSPAALMGIHAPSLLPSTLAFHQPVPLPEAPLLRRRTAIFPRALAGETSAGHHGERRAVLLRAVPTEQVLWFSQDVSKRLCLSWANDCVNSIGLALTDTLDDLISEGRINPQLAMKILSNFDQAITESLQKQVKSRLQFKVRLSARYTRQGGEDYVLRLDADTSSRKLQGSLATYRFCDEVWTFLVKNVTFKMDGGGNTVTADKVKIVSCNSKKPGET